MTDLTSFHFVAGYKHTPEQPETLWLCNHPESLDLIFSKNKASAFVFEDEQTALTAMTSILLADNHPWYTPVVEQEQPELISAATGKHYAGLKHAEEKIREALRLFNERSNSHLKLFLTVDKAENSIRGYGTGFKLGDGIINFVALLSVKGMKARCLDKHNFVVKVE